eukprot:TRINITY_DN830_c0_g6_i2.p1 TRINITY_DN830_c0_g6~~TRINITY_DN830_c0_g6_i2.p1  ORF type:complete len:769 (-),score=174.74 TRINITY_DN830_c0_g6_i2:519-2825(-)
MQSDAKSLSYYRSKREKLVYEVLRGLGNVQDWLLPFKELLIEDMKLVRPYLQRHVVHFVYKFAFVYLCMSFCLIEDNTLSSRFRLIMRVFFVTLRFYSISRKSCIEKIIIQVNLDVFILYLANALLGMSTPKKYMVNYSLLALIQSFLPSSVATKLLSAIGITAINLIVFSETIGANYVAIAFFLHCCAVMLSYYSHFMADIFSTKLTQIQEKTEAELKNKSMFVASISHDLKNPLNSLLGCLDLLKNSGSLTERDKTHILTASYSGQIMAYLIGNILDTSKIEAGRFDIDKLPMDILAEVNKIALIEHELSKKKGINLHVKVLTPLPKLVYGDAMRFSQILINLIGNSIKFVSKGYVGIILSWGSSIDEAKGKGSDSVHLIPPEEYFLEEMSGAPVKVEKREDYQEHDFQELPVSVSESIKKYSVMSPTARGKRMCTRPHSPEKFVPASISLKSQANLPKVSNSFHQFNSDLQIPGTEKAPFTIKTKDKPEKLETAVVEDSGLLMIDIIDTGIGLSEEEQKRLFKPFNQANSSVRAKYGGTGLGLWITKQLVCLMSGFIELRSKPRKGTRFTITLPFKVVKDEELVAKGGEECKTPTNRVDAALANRPSEVVSSLKAKKKLVFTGEDKSLHRMRILLVEDASASSDSLVEQVINQLMDTDCRLFYCTYVDKLEVLRAEKYSFNIIVVVYSGQKDATMKTIVSVMKDIKDAEHKQMPVCVISGSYSANCVEYSSTKEFGQLNKVTSFTFPLKEGELARELNKLRIKAM